MTTYRVNYGDHKGIEYPEYTKFPRQQAPCGITWVALEVAPNRVKRFDLSQLREVVDPRLTGMDYCYPQPAPEPLTVVLTPEMAANVNASAGVEIVVRDPVISLFSEALLVA